MLDKKPVAEMYPIRVLVCGGRDYLDTGMVQRVLDCVLQRFKARGIHLIHGAATGADTRAHWWASRRQLAGAPVTFMAVKADWEVHGPKAGAIRNAKMLNMKPELVIAFPGGAGTADMVTRAEIAGVPVYKVPQ